jgi:hypothetical protein
MDEIDDVKQGLIEAAEKMICSGDKLQAAEGRFVRDVVIPFSDWWASELKDKSVDDMMDVLGKCVGKTVGFMLESFEDLPEKKGALTDMVMIRAALAAREAMGVNEDLADLMTVASRTQQVIRSPDMSREDAEKAGEEIAREIRGG